MADDFRGLEELESFMLSAFQATAPAGRKKAVRKIVQYVRKRNQQRITRQESPDGNKWDPRKPRKKRGGSIKSAKKMMLGFRQARRLVITASADSGTVGYKGSTARIASIHHHGSIAEVTKGGPRIKYPERPLLGMAPEDRQGIKQILLDHIAGD